MENAAGGTGRAKCAKKELCFERSDKFLTVRVAGEIDHHTAAYVRVEIDRRIREMRPEKVSMDLSGVRFMDSAGLGLIMGRYALVASQGGTLTVLDPSPAVARMMALAGMERIVGIERKNMKKGGA